jgi:hypothetical protein
MKVCTLVNENGVGVEKDVIEVNQNHLTSDCWKIQFHGLKACITCEFRKGTKKHRDCGGGKTLKKMLKDPMRYFEGHVI